jgi:endonuclease YncB( thermonuclease family)
MVDHSYEVVFIPNWGRERDVYGRLLGRVEIDGEDVGEAQLKAGLAQRWMGKRAEWC